MIIQMHFIITVGSTGQREHVLSSFYSTPSRLWLLHIIYNYESTLCNVTMFCLTT